MATTKQEYVVCGTHSVLFSAAGNCPDCEGSGPKGVDYSTAQKVEIVSITGGQE